MGSNCHLFVKSRLKSYDRLYRGQPILHEAQTTENTLVAVDRCVSKTKMIKHANICEYDTVTRGQDRREGKIYRGQFEASLDVRAQGLSQPMEILKTHIDNNRVRNSKLCKSRHEPIGMRGFLRFGTVF